MGSKLGEFKGNKTLVLFSGDVEQEERYPFSFGIKKAKLILENIEDIKKFVEENDKGTE